MNKCDGHLRDIFSYHRSVFSDSIKVGALLCECRNTKFLSQVNKGEISTVKRLQS